MGVAGPGGSRDDARWRVFVSHTFELRDFPKSTSYVAEVERAIAAAGHVIVDMADFAAADNPVRATGAVQAFARAHAVTSAAGLAADTRRLFDGIASHDRSGILAEVRAAQDL